MVFFTLRDVLGRTENPKKVYKIGDSVKCFIKEINGDKIALSVKYPDLNPWNNAQRSML